MNIYTEMAIAAYRNQERASRRLSKAQNEVLKAASLVPTEEKKVWFLGTEVVRMEFDLQDAQVAKDHEAETAILELLGDLRRQYEEADRQLEADKALADHKDRPVTPGEASLDDWPDRIDHPRHAKPDDRPHGTALGRHHREA